jgi:hypothetical protein
MTLSTTATMSRLSRIILTVRRGIGNGEQNHSGISSAVHFYNQCIGLPIYRVTDDSAELVLMTTPLSSSSSSVVDNNDNNNNNAQLSSAASSPLVLLTIRTVDGDESKLCTGYTPIITFEVQAIDTIISQCIQYGAQLDGPIQYPAYGKVASLRTPHGHMIGLYEPTI